MVDVPHEFRPEIVKQNSPKTDRLFHDFLSNDALQRSLEQNGLTFQRAKTPNHLDFDDQV